jgi:hypothetical protein
MNFKSIADLTNDIKKYIIPNIPKDVSVVYGVPRSGVLPASIIAMLMGLDLAIVGQESIYSGERKKNFVNNKTNGKILLIDDTTSTGASLFKFKKILDKPCITCSVYTSNAVRSKIDIPGVVVQAPRIFEWNFLGASYTDDSLYDMDGVICQDPTVFDDDGEGYKNALINAKPLFIPQRKVKAICTNRLERWRCVTEDWLQRHGVQYGKLIMQQYATAAERRKQGNPGLYKAKHYKQLGGSLFVESHDVQAKVIAANSSKPCLSIESMSIF